MTAKAIIRGATIKEIFCREGDRLYKFNKTKYSRINITNADNKISFQGIIFSFTQQKIFFSQKVNFEITDFK